jgi:hypothetical protein
MKTSMQFHRATWHKCHFQKQKNGICGTLAGVIEIHGPNAMVDDDGYQPEVNLLFVVDCSSHLT